MTNLALVYIQQLNARANLFVILGFYTVSQKKQDTKLLAITSLIITRFSKFFTSRLYSIFATNWCLNIPSRF